MGLIVVDLPWPENKNFLKNVKKKYLFYSINFSNNILLIEQKKL